MTYTIKTHLLLITILLSLQIKSQNYNPTYTVSTDAILKSGDQVPFWLISNQNGKYNPKSSGIYSELKMNYKSDTLKHFRLKTGLDFNIGYSNKFETNAIEYYSNIEWRFIKLKIGAQNKTIEKSKLLSSGNMLYSGNAPNIPKIELAIDNYISVPYTNGYIKFKGNVAHGWFMNDGYVKHKYLHEKSVFIKFGGNFPINLSYGFEHYAVWGGTSPRFGKLPSNLEALYDVTFGKKPDTTKWDLPASEALNVLGDHRGSHNLCISYQNSNYKIAAYYQSIFEDNSGIHLKNFPDGLWGLSYINKSKDKPIISAITTELIYTKFQGGYDTATFTSTGDNYFNNSTYRAGWTFNEYTIGTPLIVSPSLYLQSIKNSTPYTYITNNRTITYYTSLEGYATSRLSYRVIISFTNSFGTYAYPLQKKSQTSGLLKLKYHNIKNKNINLSLNLAFDNGNLLGNNKSISISLKKTF